MNDEFLAEVDSKLAERNMKKGRQPYYALQTGQVDRDIESSVLKLKSIDSVDNSLNVSNIYMCNSWNCDIIID